MSLVAIAGVDVTVSYVENDVEAEFVDEIGIEVVRAAKIAELSEAYDNALAAGFSYNGVNFGYGPDDRERFNDYTNALFIGVAPDKIAWKGQETDAPYIEYDREKMKGILSAALLHKNECVRKKLELDAAVSAAGTAEVVNAVSWK